MLLATVAPGCTEATNDFYSIRGQLPSNSDYALFHEIKADLVDYDVEFLAVGPNLTGVWRFAAAFHSGTECQQAREVLLETDYVLHVEPCILETGDPALITAWDYPWTAPACGQEICGRSEVRPVEFTSRIVDAVHLGNATLVITESRGGDTLWHIADGSVEPSRILQLPGRGMTVFVPDWAGGAWFSTFAFADQPTEFDGWRVMGKDAHQMLDHASGRVIAATPDDVLFRNDTSVTVVNLTSLLPTELPTRPTETRFRLVGPSVYTLSRNDTGSAQLNARTTAGQAVAHIEVPSDVTDFDVTNEHLLLWREEAVQIQNRQDGQIVMERTTDGLVQASLTSEGVAFQWTRGGASTIEWCELARRTCSITNDLTRHVEAMFLTDELVVALEAPQGGTIHRFAMHESLAGIDLANGD